MSRLHLKYPNIRDEAVTAAKALFTAKPWSMTETDQQATAQVFVDTVCASYGIASADVAITGDSDWRGRNDNRYTVADFSEDSLSDEPELLNAAKITMTKFSFFTLLRLVRDHINESTESSRVHPRAWAASLFYKVAPVTFRKAVRAGTIRCGVSARDTFTTESWNKLQAAGYVYGTSLQGTPEEWAGVLSGDITNRVEAQAVVEAEEDEDYDDDDELDFASIVEDSIPDADEDDGEDVSETSDAEVGVASSVILTPENVQGLDNMNRDALRARAAELQIPGRGRMLAPELRTAIREFATQ